jgi:hypothetical protein
MACAFQFNRRPKPTTVTPDSNCLGMILSENRFTLFRIMPIAPGDFVDARASCLPDSFIGGSACSFA